MEVGAEDQLTRRERLRAEREHQHAAPARIRLRLAGVMVLVIALLSWLAVSWLSSAAPAGVPLPEPPPLQGAAQPQEGPAGMASSTSPGGTPGGPEAPSAEVSAGAPPGVGEAPSEAEEPGPVVVHVGGAVTDPGVVELDAGARVHEAIEAAGGMTSKADPGGLNLAAPVQDGTLIWVPTPQELETGTGPPGGGQGSAGMPGAAPDAAPDAAPGSAPGPAPGPAPGGADGAAPGASAGALIDLNSADAAALQKLPGIGPALSERIISHRETNGPFRSLEELAGVSGIGPVILENVEGLVTW